MTKRATWEGRDGRERRVQLDSGDRGSVALCSSDERAGTWPGLQGI